MSDEEEARAMQYRLDQRARNAEYRQRHRRLAGSVAYRQQLAEDWDALRRGELDDIPLLEDEAEERMK